MIGAPFSAVPLLLFCGPVGSGGAAALTAAFTGDSSCAPSDLQVRRLACPTSPRRGRGSGAVVLWAEGGGAADCRGDTTNPTASLDVRRHSGCCSTAQAPIDRCSFGWQSGAASGSSRPTARAVSHTAGAGAVASRDAAAVRRSGVWTSQARRSGAGGGYPVSTIY